MEDQPTNEVNDARPQSIHRMIGQRSVLDQVIVALDACHQDGLKFPDSLLVGGPGLGKSQLANLLAVEMATDLHEVLGQSISRISDLNALLLSATDKSIVHFDECHELSKQMQTALYLCLDKRVLHVGGKRGGTPQTIRVADCTVLLSSTDENFILQPLRDRMKLTLRFDFYSSEDLAVLVHQRAVALNWDVHEELFPLIAQRSKGIPRIGLRLLQSCRRSARAVGSNTIKLAHYEQACSLEQIDSLGLGFVEQQYLKLLAESDARLNVLSARIGLPTRTLSEVIEPVLIRLNLVTKNGQGLRCLTGQGHEHLANSCGDHV
ncbi:AAA family ATPase [bacterium]|nr:AAA family ATPase [bacterium]